MLLLPIAVPAAAGIIALLLPGQKTRWITSLVAVAATAVEVALAVILFPADQSLTIPWLGFGIELSLKLSRMSAFFLLAIAGFAFLVVPVRKLVHEPARPPARSFFAWMLFTVALASGAVLADNLVLLLVFWGGLLLTLSA